MSKLISLEDLKEPDYNKLGLMSGLEIHQQLNCAKLFCPCPCDIVPNETFNKEVIRRLRFSQSETGSIDMAAVEEFKKGKYNVYKYNDETACLIDLDEEPPIGPNQKAFNTAIRLSMMMDLKLFNKIQFMRKLIIDGSVTSGFQRTAILGTGGSLEFSFGKVEIEGLNIEEDSCRTLERKDGHTIFSLDRQGIPLVEITTGPQMQTPAQVFEVAKELGDILRSFEETRRGLGTIRQDLNVSIKGGARIEIKGSQNLKLIPEVVKHEAIRQKIYLSILEELKVRGINSKNYSDKKVQDISKLFSKTKSEIILKNTKDKESGVLAIKLNSFKGLLGHELQAGHRFASEISDKNKKVFPQIKGLFHSDELPNYGISEEEVKSISKELKLSEKDSFILIASDKKIAEESLNNVLNVIEFLMQGVPSEVRQVDPKGTMTKYLRPMPGAARMYPETDIRDIVLEESYLKEMKAQIPELYSKRLERFSKDTKLDSSKASEILENFSEEEMKRLIKISGKSANSLYSTLIELPKDIKKRDNINPLELKVSLLEDLLKISKEEEFNSNTIRDIFISLYKDKISETDNLKEYLDKKSLIQEKVDLSQIEDKIKEILEKNPKAPFGALMGIAMKEFQNKVDGKIISQLLNKFNK